jgi:hypothetical protein
MFSNQGSIDNLPVGSLWDQTHVEIEIEPFKQLPAQAQTADWLAISRAARGALPARDEYHAIPR